MKHVPKPWTVSQGIRNNSYSIEAPACTIAHIRNIPKRWSAKAIAQLIAVSPDLLDFAIQVKYSLGGGCNPEHEACPYTHDELIEIANELINKIEEES